MVASIAERKRTRFADCLKTDGNYSCREQEGKGSYGRGSGGYFVRVSRRPITARFVCTAG